MNKRYLWLVVLLLGTVLWGCGSKGSDPPVASPNPFSSVSSERQVEVIEVVPRVISYTVSTFIEDFSSCQSGAGIEIAQSPIVVLRQFLNFF